jgi:hypothetical protein
MSRYRFALLLIFGSIFIYGLFFAAASNFWLPVEMQAQPVVEKCISFLKQLFTLMATVLTACYSCCIFYQMGKEALHHFFPNFSFNAFKQQIVNSFSSLMPEKR